MTTPTNWGTNRPCPPKPSNPGLPIQGGAGGMRQYGGMMPINTASAPPKIGAATGLGTGGGVGLHWTPDNSGWFDVEIIPGAGVATSGNFTLNFASTPPTLFLAPHQQMGTVTQGTVSNVVTISWTGATMLPGQRTRIHFEWATAN